MNILFALHRLFWAAADWLYPPHCAGCGHHGERFCASCLSQVVLITDVRCAFCGDKTSDGSSVCIKCNRNSVSFNAAASWAVYGGELRKAIHALKYRQDMALGAFFATFLIATIEKQGWNFDFVIPVPLSPDRMKERGYNQSELLSRPIAFYFQVPHSSMALIRIKDTGTQVNHTKIERDLMLKDAFYANPDKLNGRKVLLVDDIITTGSTINHCAKALKEAGTSEVYALSIAKTLKKRPSVQQ